MPQQIELFSDSPFSLRLSIDEAIRIFVDNYWKNKPSNNFSAAHFRRFRMFFKGYYLDSISKADVERFRSWMKEMGYHPSTINRGHMILSRMYHKFAEYKDGRFLNGEDVSRIVLPAKNPAALVPKINERQFARQVYVSKERKKILMSYADEDLSEIIDTLYWSELRASDLFRITHQNVLLQKCVINGIQHKTISTNNPTGVPYKVHIPEEKLIMIKRRIDATKPGTPIFRRTNLQKRWHKVRTLAKMPEVQLRDLRGSAASYLLDHGVDPETVRKTLGHTTLRMLPSYDKRPDSVMAEATKKLV